MWSSTADFGHLRHFVKVTEKNREVQNIGRKPLLLAILTIIFLDAKHHCHLPSTDISLVTATVKLRRVELLMELHLRATRCHLPYGITQCYLPPDASEHTPPYPQPDRPVLDLPTQKRWWLVAYWDGLPVCRHPSSNRTRCRATSLIETSALTTTPRCHAVDFLNNY